MKKLIKFSSIIFSAFIVIIFSFSIFTEITVKANYNDADEENIIKEIYSSFKDSISFYAKNYEGLTASSGEVISEDKGIKRVYEAETKDERKYLIPGGELVGIRLKTDGVLIVGTESFETDEGQVNPAKDAGIVVGDTLKSVDNTKISSNMQLAQIIEASDGRALEAEIIRDGQTFEITITPEISSVTGMYKCGLWIRDSTGGIGTLTYCDIETCTFGSLGHGIYDPDTGKLLPTQMGELSGATLSGVKKGISGTAGELRGCITGDVFADIYSNNENGVYGNLTVTDYTEELMPAAFDYEITTGNAQIISTVQGDKKEYFDIEIEKYSKSSENKNFVIRVTDERLLEITGGIIQGMSGSPIIQNGKIIGAVTHVFVNEPTKGYGITIENMLNSSN